MNIAFISSEGQSCMQTWSENACALYNKIKNKHIVTWIGREQYAEAQKFYQAINETDITSTHVKYTQLLGKLLSDVINQSYYDLAVCCHEIPYEYIITNIPVISISDDDKWTETYINNALIEECKKINVYIPVYAINMKEREDRREHIINEFKGKPEFKLHLMEACIHRKGTIGLWNSMVQIVRMAKENKEDFVIICEDDHFFTEGYSPKLLIKEIQEAYLQKAEILSGGIGGFGNGFRTGFRRYWIDWLWCTQFIVVYASFYDKMLSYEFKEDDAADEVISALASNKMVIYPFISEQKDFGYSDVTKSNDEHKGLIRRIFKEAKDKLAKIERQSLYIKYL